MQLAPFFPDTIDPAFLETIDYRLLSQDSPSESLKMFQACQTSGFFLLENHNVNPNPIFSLGNEIFQLPLDSKFKYHIGTTGSYFGYKPSGSSIVDSKGTPDHAEFCNISKDDILNKVSNLTEKYPNPVVGYAQELEKFISDSHSITRTVLSHLALNLGIQKENLLNLHKLETKSGDQVRVTAQPVLEIVDNEPIITIGEHTDFGSLTVLFNRLGGLQVLDRNETIWKYVKPKENCAIINVGDALVKILGGRVHSGLHRVVTPPGEQSKVPRSSVVYFGRPNSDVKLMSIVAGDDCGDEEILTADEWIAKRVFLRNVANFKGKETYIAQRGTEHKIV